MDSSLSLLETFILFLPLGVFGFKKKQTAQKAFLLRRMQSSFVA